MNIHIKNLSLGLLSALFFSAFIYFEEYGLTNKLVNTLFGIVAFWLLLYIPKKAILSAGFFIGLFWFYWIGYSFEYQGVGYMTPIIMVAFGFVYLLFFLPLYFTDKAFIRALLLFGLSFVEPLGWNWMKFELLFVESYIGLHKWQLASLLLALSLPSLVGSRYRFLPLALLVVAFNYTSAEQKDAPLKIKLITTDVKQELKWLPHMRYPTIDMIFHEIESAKAQKYDLIVLPESVFPLYLNQNPELIEEMLHLSNDISIVAGALLREDGKNYNVTYHFEDGDYTVAKKLILVPFGEYIPLPAFAREFINKRFFAGGSDFITADEPTDFTIKGVKFRNAICYEATSKELYEGELEYIIATSNNAWFAPSIEPTLQNLLLKYFGRKHGVTIYHSANYKGSGKIK